MNVENIKNCTGCGCCKNICPVDCITMVDDAFKGLQPQIDNEKCINCSKCFKSCPSVNNSKFAYPQKAYATWSLDDNQRKSSASGGLAATFYKKVIDLGGTGFGVCFDKEFNLNFFQVTNNADIKKACGSKYVQSNTENSYTEIKEKLNKNEKVVFIGSPCQVDGLKHFLGQEYDNLILVDIICHGVPSQKLLKEHISTAEKSESIKADKLSFRKDNEFVFSLSNNEHSYNKNGTVDQYILGFKEGLFYSEKCYSCKYAQEQRVSDITIGDFWGLGTETPFNHPYSGSISLALINTPKGNQWFNLCKNSLFYEERAVAEGIKGNAQLNSPMKKHKKTDEFFEKYSSNFDATVYSLLKDEIVANEKTLKKSARKTVVRNLAKKILKRGD